MVDITEAFCPVSQLLLLWSRARPVHGIHAQLQDSSYWISMVKQSISSSISERRKLSHDDWPGFMQSRLWVSVARAKVVDTGSTR